MRQAAIPAGGMLSFFEKMARREGTAPALLASHPATVERLASLRRAIAAQGPYPAKAIDQDWTRLRAAL